MPLAIRYVLSEIYMRLKEKQIHGLLQVMVMVMDLCSAFSIGIYTLFQNGHHLNIIFFLFKFALDASFLRLKFKRILLI